MFVFLVPSYSPDTCLSNYVVLHPSWANMSLQWEAQISTTSRHWNLLTCSQTPWQSNYSRTQQLDIWIYNLISIRFWPRFQGLVACHLGSAASITLMMEATGTLKCHCISARLHGATTENIFGVRSVWCAKDKLKQLSHLYPQEITLHLKH